MIEQSPGREQTVDSRLSFLERDAKEVRKMLGPCAPNDWQAAKLRKVIADIGELLDRMKAAA